MSASRVVTKLIYKVEHVSLSTEAQFPVTIGVRVVISVVFELWFSEKIRST